MTAASSSDPIILPDPPEPPSRRPFPIVASIVPVVGAVVMWQVLGSVHMLWFAALGPLMAVASLVDGARGARRERRRALAALSERIDEARGEVAQRHARERAVRLAETPDAAGVLAGSGALWRRRGPIAMGRGEASSAVEVRGGEGDEAEELRRDARVLDDAPVLARWQDGVCVRGDGAVARAVARGLVAQVCLREPATAVHLALPPFGEDWAEQLPHRARPAEAATRLAALADGQAAPPDADVVFALAPAGGAVPPECAVVLDVGPALDGAVVEASEETPVRCEALALAQCRALAERLAVAQAATGGLTDRTVPLGEVRARDEASHDLDAHPAGLRAAVGVGPATADDPAPLEQIDLVSDGPHAVVVGTTGAGKSEMLTTWIVALAQAHSPADLVFLLVDFKGGTAFDALAGLPHVTGIVTDLDGSGAVRAVEGLRAEIRRRERVIARAGARDVSDPRTRLARLVIVVDEFAALLQDHPDLHAVFADVAARGRALGMHLVLGSQRAAGVMKDALVANSPLRIALRVAERTESAQIVGDDQAAEIPGDAAHRGVGAVRRAGDSRAGLVRFALAARADIRRAEEAWPGVEPAPGPLLPPLPDVWAPAEPSERGRVVIGLADDPAAQRQPQAELRVGSERGIIAVGGASSGRSSFAAWVAHAARAAGHDVVAVPRDREGAWDALERAEESPPELFVVDDVDALPSRFPQEHAQRATEMLETIVRDAGSTGTTIVLTAARLNGPAGRLAELVPRRAILTLPTRVEHTGAGADAASFDPERAPGRAVLDRRETQLAFDADAHAALDEVAADPERWEPGPGLSAVVLRAAAHRLPALRAAWEGRAEIVEASELPPGATPGDVDGPVVVVGDPDAWQRQIPLLRRASGGGEVVVGACCPSELRTLVGERSVPPYAMPRAGRAWALGRGARIRRVVLP